MPGGTDDGQAASALAKAEEAYEKSIRERVSEHVDGAVETLGRLSKGQPVRRGAPKPSPMVTLTAASKVLEYAGGKPETRVEKRAEDAGVTIVIQQFGEKAQKVLQEVIDAHRTNLPSGAFLRQQRESAEVLVEKLEGGPQSVVHRYEVPE